MGAEGPRLAGQEPPGFSGEYAGDIGQQRLWKTERVHDTASRSSDRVRASAVVDLFLLSGICRPPREHSDEAE